MINLNYDEFSTFYLNNVSFVGLGSQKYLYMRCGCIYVIGNVSLKNKKPDFFLFKTHFTEKTFHLERWISILKYRCLKQKI